MKTAIIIGSGIAGIASALRLRRQGYDVTVFEANSYPGGKLHSFEKEGFRFDYGPSLFTMPQLVDELFELYGEEASDHFQYIRKDKVCNYFWEDGTRFSVSGDESDFINHASKSFNTPTEVLEQYLQLNRLKYKQGVRLLMKQLAE